MLIAVTSAEHGSLHCSTHSISITQFVCVQLFLLVLSKTTTKGDKMRPIDYPYHMTHQEIADQLGISRVRVRQLEASGIKKLRKRMALHQYYLDHISSSSESRNQDHIPFV